MERGEGFRKVAFTLSETVGAVATQLKIRLHRQKEYPFHMGRLNDFWDRPPAHLPYGNGPRAMILVSARI